MFDRLKKAGLERQIKVKIAQNIDSRAFPNDDTKELAESGAAEVYEYDYSKNKERIGFASLTITIYLVPVLSL